MNLSINFTNKWDMFGGKTCINPDTCKEMCLQQSISYHYEFVYLFLVAFMFDQIRMFAFTAIKDPNLAYKVNVGLKMASYCLNLVGAVWFLFFIVK